MGRIRTPAFAARPGVRRLGACLLGAWLLAAAPAAWAQGAARNASLAPTSESVERLDARALVFPRTPPVRLAAFQLRISGIDPEDVRRTLQAWNQRSELFTVRRDGVAVAPYLLRDAFDMGPDKLLQLRVGSQSARLVFQLEWR